MKKLINIILFITLAMPYFSFTPKVSADSSTYTVVSVRNDGNLIELGTYNDYNAAKDVMDNYNSNINDVSIIKKDNKVVNASYGIFRLDSNLKTVNIYSDYGTGYISPAYSGDSLILNYNPSNNMVQIMISGIKAWVSLDAGIVYPISYITNGTGLSYDTNKKYVKILYLKGIRLREGPGTNYNQIGCNGANQCSSSQGGIWTEAGAIYEWLNYGEVSNDGTNEWYKVNINGNIGYIANEVAARDLEEFVASQGNKEDLKTYYYVNGNGELYHQYYAEASSSNLWSTRLGKAPLYLKQNIKYYSFDGNYFYDDFIKLVNDVKSNNHNNAVNKMPYYNYYQYLPTRTRSVYNADNINSYIGMFYSTKINREEFYDLVYDEASNTNKWVVNSNPNPFPKNGSMLYGEGEAFINSQEKYGVNAIETLALAINESGWGRSGLSVRQYNIFGHGAFDYAPDANAASYESIAAGIMAHAYKYIAKDYSNPINGYNYYGSHYGNKLSGNNVSYASDAYWGEKMAGNYYSFDKNFSFQDFNQRNTLGIKQFSEAAPVYSLPTTQSTFYYHLKNRPNIPVTILEEVEGEEINGNNIWYKIQSDVPIDESRKVVETFDTYNFDTSYVYIHSSYIYKESKEPVISARDLVINSGLDFNPLSGVSAYDAWDGDLTNKIEVVMNNVDISKAGTYNVVYKVTDSENNTVEKTIKVDVLTSKPTINAIDKTIVLYDEFNPLVGVIASDYEDGDLTNNITVVSSNVDSTKIGTYNITYSVKDSHDNETTKTIAINVVEPNYEEKDSIFYLDYIKNVNNRLQIKGFNTINGIDNDLNIEIRYDIEFVDIDKQSSYIQHATRITDDNEMTRPVYGLDDKNYTYSWFKLDVDLANLPAGNYKMNVISRTNQYIATSVVSNKLYKTQDTSFSGEKQVLTKIDFNDKTGAIELNIRSEELAKKTATSEYNQYDTYRVFEFDNDNNLHLKGVSYSYGMDLSSEKDIIRTIIFENMENYQKYEFELGSIDNGLYDVTLPVDDNLSKTRAWYDKTIDISSIPDGKYIIYIKTISNITDIAEFTEKLNRDLNDVITTKDEKKYSFNINQQRGNRIELIVEKI